MTTALQSDAPATLVTPASPELGGGSLQRLVSGHWWCELHLADCKAIVPRVSNLMEIGAVITDPPYGMEWEGNQRFSGGNSRRGKGTRHEQIIGDDEEYDPAHLLALNVPTVMWGANHYWHKLPPGAALIWQKRNEHALGTFLSDGEVAYMNVGCGVYICRKVFAGSRRAIEGGVGAYDGSLHPNQKPVMLMTWAMERAKVPLDAIVLDPYMGSGTTGVSCLRTGRPFIGIEKDPKHFATAVARLEREINQGALL